MMGSFHVRAQQLDELDTLRHEAQELRQRHTLESIERVARCIERGIRPLVDDVHMLQHFMGARVAQDRYGK